MSLEIGLESPASDHPLKPQQEMSNSNVQRFPGPEATRFTPNPWGASGNPEGTVRQNAQSLALLCRKMSPDVVALLHTIIRGEHPEATVGDQLKAAQLVLDRGYGRAVSVVEMSVTQAPKSVRELTREQLVRLANGEVIELDASEYSTVEATVHGS